MCSALGLIAMLTCALPAGAADPLGVMRAFCRADGAGARLHPRTWQGISHLVTWQIEPAWDRVLLIKGYQIGGTRQNANGVAVEVVYTVSGDVRPGKVIPAERLETHTYQLVADASSGTWRVAGSPWPPAVFESQTNAQAIADSLDPRAGTFLSNSLFVWQTLSRSGWTLSYLDTQHLAAASVLAETTDPQPGDLVFYFAGDEPYHVGFLVASDAVIAATLNGGVRRVPIDAFPGEMRILRLVGNQPSATKPEDTATPGSAAPIEGTRLRSATPAVH